MALNTEKYINVYYNKGDRKPYDVNGKPIAYLGQDYVGANEATIIRFNIGDDTGVVEGVADVKRPDGEKAFLVMSKVTIGTDVFYELPLTDWHTAKVGKLVIAFKAFDGAITINDGVIDATGLRVIVSDIFNIDIGYSPNSVEEAPAFDPNDVATFVAALSTKLDKVNGINVVQALPTPGDNSLNGRWYLVKSGSPESVGKLFVFNNANPVEVELGTSQFNFSTTGIPTDALTAGQLRYNDTTGSLDLGLKGDHVLKVGEVLVKRVRNDDASSLKVGQLVYVYGAVGNSGLLLVKKATNIGESTSSKTFGMVATAMNTTNAKDGYVYLYGLLQGVNLNDSDIAEGSFVSGDVGSQLWLGENGKITKTLPTADNKHSVFVGYLDSYGGSGNNCGIYTKIQNGYEIGELHDVRISAVADNHILRYNSTRQVWENTAELTTAETDISNIEDGTTIVGKALGDQNGNVINTTYLTIANGASTYVPLSSKGVANGVAPLGSDNKIPSIHLPGGVDDIKEFANLASFPVVGEASIIYVALDTNKIYRWGGSSYVEISSSLALGTTASTAFPGDRGLATETQSNNIVSGVQGLTDTRITNSAVGVNPLIVNSVASTTARLQEWQINGVFVAGISPNGRMNMNEGIANSGSSNNAFVNVSTTGTIINRNINDTNVPLIVRKQQGTGNILELQTGTSDKKLEVDVNGWLYQNGVRWINGFGTNSTFVGLGSGGTSTNNTENTAVGYQSLNGLTFGNFNVALGHRSLFNSTTASSNTAIGYRSGQTITSGSTNTFIGFDAGNVSQLATATNSTALGHQAYTDKSNQMVFGNASVTEFKFDRNASAVLLAPNLTASSSLNHLFERTTTDTNTIGSSLFVRRKTSGTAADGFSSSLSFQIDDSSNNPTTIGLFGALRSGANNSGRLFFSTNNAGTTTEKMTILPNGNVGIGTTSPAYKLSIAGASATSQNLLLTWATNQTDAYSRIRSQFSDANATVGSEIRFHQRQTDQDGSYQTFWTTNASGTLAERLRIHWDGLVGINETTPTGQLQVRSGATNRVPLIVDTLASHTTGIQEWRINGSAKAYMNTTGNLFAEGLANYASSINAYVITATTGTTISRNVADTNPALIVNLANSSATGNIQVWQKAGSAKVVIDGDGRIFTGFGILNNTSANNSRVDVETTGTIIRRNVNDSNVVLKVQQTNASASGRLQEWILSSTTLAYVTNAGDFFNAGGTYGTISDLRVKENIVEARDYTDDIMKLRVVKYSLKKDKEAQATKLGFIAQEVEEVFPNMIETSETEEIKDLKSIKMSVLIPMLVKTIQELKKEVDELKKR